MLRLQAAKTIVIGELIFCVKVHVVDFNSHAGTFAVQSSEHTVVITYSDFEYKWPQQVKK